ncbi:FkbM family methyltransferase [Candidatus Bathyarchaeota archaeon]|nr:MAG: FkbM family methyltransferase [Candidatus Bathyarchaeota archaeon]
MSGSRLDFIGRLYVGLIASLIVVALIRGRFKSTGHLMPGTAQLRVTTAGVLADVVPGNNSLALLAGVQEPKTTTWFKVKQGEVVVDVGAHIGRYTLIAAKQALKVVSIEPDPSNFAMLESNIKLNEFCNVIPLQLAASSSHGKRRFYLANGGDTGTSSLERSWFWTLDAGVKRKEIEVECETLDSVVDSLGLEQIDWLKIDVEGHETAVLEGAGALLARTRKLILEVAEGNETCCRELVRRAGFELVAIDQGKKEDGLRASSNWLLHRTNS